LYLIDQEFQLHSEDAIEVKYSSAIASIA